MRGGGGRNLGRWANLDEVLELRARLLGGTPISSIECAFWTMGLSLSSGYSRKGDHAFNTEGVLRSFLPILARTTSDER